MAKTERILSIQVTAEWDPEAKVWVATSDDIPLATEADTLENLEQKLSIMIPELLEANGALEDEDIREIPFHLIAHRDHTISLRD